jgi:multidrug efflux system membrane fusion protein
MQRRRLLVLATLLALAACGKPAADKPAEKEAETPGITLKAEEIKSLGIVTVPARAASYRLQISGYGVVTALDTIAQNDAEVMTAQAAAAQSQAAAARAQSLATGEEAAVSREVVETAQSKAAADQAALLLARRKTDAAFGRNAPWHDAASRQAIMARLASGHTVLVRVIFPLGALGNVVPETLEIARLGANPKSWTSSSVWEAPADNTFPGRGFYALVDGSDLAQNEHVTAMVPVGAAESGVTVPANALIYGESEAWVYVQTQPGTFLKTRIDIGKALGDGYFVADGAGIRAGQPVVTSGAGLLLARETNPSTAAED